jgi:hypothetical protein
MSGCTDAERMTCDRATKAMPSNIARRRPKRSKIAPTGIATKRYTNCHEPRMKPIVVRLMSRSTRIGAMSGASEALTMPNEPYTKHNKSNMTHR